MPLQRQRSKRSRRREFLASLITDPVQSAQAAGLRYVSDNSPGIQRQVRGKGFVYIGLDANGHIQATARDAKGRKQYRYHPLWRQVRDQTKFTRMIAFSDALPMLRERVDSDLGLRDLPREKVLATVVR